MFVKITTIKGVTAVINIDQIAGVELSATMAMIYMSAQKYISVSREQWDKIESELHLEDLRLEE